VPLWSDERRMSPPKRPWQWRRSRRCQDDVSNARVEGLRLLLFERSEYDVSGLVRHVPHPGRVGVATRLRGRDSISAGGQLSGQLAALLVQMTALCSGRGVPRLAEGAAPQLWTADPRGGPKISRSGPAWE